MLPPGDIYLKIHISFTKSRKHIISFIAVFRVHFGAWEELTFRVEPLGPISRCLRFTNRSLFLTRVPILMMSHAMSSCNIRTAWKPMSVMRTLEQIPFLLLSPCIKQPPPCMTAALCTWAQWSSPVRMGHSGPEAWWDLWLLQWRTGQTFSSWCKLWHCPRSDPERLWYAEENMHPCYTEVQ